MTREEVVAGAREAIERGSKSFRAASRLFAPEVRERTWLLYCWCRHCDDVCDGQSFGFGRTAAGEVEDLREKTRLTVAGSPPDELPFQALGQLLSEVPLPVRLLEDHLAGFALDEQGWQPRSEEDLDLYCYHVAGAVGCMMAIVMGVPADDQATLERAADLGIAFQISNIARDVREDHERGRCYLPQDWLDSAGIDREALFAPQNEEARAALVRKLVDRVQIYEDSARRGVHRLAFRSRLAVLAALRIYGAIGRRVGQLGAAAWDQRVTVGKAEKLALLVPSFVEAITAGRRP